MATVRYTPEQITQALEVLQSIMDRAADERWATTIAACEAERIFVEITFEVPDFAARILEEARRAEPITQITIRDRIRELVDDTDQPTV